MLSIVEEIKELFKTYKKSKIINIYKLPQSGSDRIYFRIRTNDESYIATYNENVKENKTFIKFSKHFLKNNNPVPKIFARNKNETIYLQEDFGDTSLLDELEARGHNDYVYKLYRQSLKSLARLQIKGDNKLNYSWCITSQEFGRQAILSDLLYFKYYFLDTLKIPYDKENDG